MLDRDGTVIGPATPRRFGTSTGCRSAAGSIPASTSAASASCGTRAGETKLVASIVRSPQAASRWMNSILVAVSTIFGSACSPSRGPTS